MANILLYGLLLVRKQRLGTSESPGPWIGWVVFLFGLGAFCLWLVGFNRETAAVAGAVPAVAAPASPLPARPLKG